MLQRWELGNALRRIREERGMTIADVITAMHEQYGFGFSNAKLSRIETAKRGVLPRDVQDLCVFYGVSDAEREHLIQLAMSARQPEHFQTSEDSRGYLWYLTLERIATRIREYSSMFIPGLLQTPEYSSIVENLASLSPQYYYSESPPAELPHTPAGRSALRIERQKLLDQKSPLQLHAIIDENAFRRRLPHAGVMEGQLRHILQATSRPNIRIQVIPYEVGLYPGAENTYWSILDTPPGEQHPPRTVYTESFTGAHILDSEAEVARMDEAFDAISRLALKPEDSRSLVSRILAETYGIS
jgi:transcriptional regulator with XRE-family HTH domain